MIDLSNYSCDKCSREFSRYCKHCFHTKDKAPTKFKRKKITGCQTPEYRCPTMPPAKPAKPKENVSNLAGICPYETPCGWCYKWDKKCDLKIGCENPMKQVEVLSIPVKSFKKPIDIPYIMPTEERRSQNEH